MKMDTPIETNCPTSPDEMKITQLENELAFYKEQIETLQLTLEVANERWVEQVNKNTSLEVELRKLRKV